MRGRSTASTPGHKTERQFSRPHRPPGLRLANLAGPVAARLRPGLLSLERDELVATAHRRTGLVGLPLDLGAGSTYAEGLDHLLASLADESALTPAGRYFAREQVLTSLANRLQLRARLDADPGLATRAIAPPLVIVGLPRSGTTFAQHLLARDPAHRTLLHWEAARPGAERSAESDAAARSATERGLRHLDYLAPDARSIHPVDVAEPTECVTLFSTSFASLELATINQVPSFLDWCLSADHRGSYEEYVLQLRVLEQADRRPRWLLKSPAHLFWLDTLADVLPDVRIVQIHRDPLEVLGSFCSLSAVLCGIGSDRIDVAGLGERWAPAWAEGLARAEAARRSWPPGRVVDVDFRDLVGDPMGEVRRIYAAFDLELDRPAEAAMRAYTAGHGHDGSGTHRYSLDQFGLDPDREADRFARFR
jgi:hypothetical protein